ncbi:MAG TPA: NADH-quinone oxidoreductase subunit NuoE [Dehalococcoidia bacterium]|nr:NADH-quinone oxidoreductase subunit NuoE [Dehalococcoidia bacterium]
MEELRQILTSHKGERRELICILQEVSEKFGYLPKEAMLEIARFMQIPESTIYGVATFYNQFRFTPIGKHPIKVCLGTACHMKGGKLTLEALERELEIKVGDLTPDGEFSLERVACIGCCVMAPVMVVSKDIYPKMTPLKVEEVLVRFKEKTQSEETPHLG